MSDEVSAMLEAVVGRILADNPSTHEPPRFSKSLWQALSEVGLFDAPRDPAAGGAGLAPSDLLGTLMALGRAAAHAPVADALAAEWLAAQAGLPRASGIALIAEAEPGWSIAGSGGDAALTICFRALPWAAEAEWLVTSLAVDGEACVLRLPVAAALIEGEATNLAGEPCRNLAFSSLPLASIERSATRDSRDALFCGAAFRSAQMTGALAHATELSVGYAGERIQFGRPIGSFQAVQQMAAELECQRMAAEAAAARGLSALGAAAPLVGVAIAKTRSGEAATLGAALAHQIHGAMGCTTEYSLQARTRRLWDWRDSFGSEHRWAVVLGDAAMAEGADQVWDLIRAEAPPAQVPAEQGENCP